MGGIMEEKFDNMGIYDLRNYARAIGVKAPTTLKRDELINKIMQIKQGNVPKAEPTNKGRPPMHKSAEEIMLNVIMSQNAVNKGNVSSANLFTNAVLSTNSNMEIEAIDFTGYYKTVNGDYGVVCKDIDFNVIKPNSIVLLKDLVLTNNLKTGDFVKGRAKYVESNNLYLAYQVSEVNDKPVKESLERIDFQNITPNYPSEQITLNFDGEQNMQVIDNLFPLAKGARVAINFEKDSDKVSILKDILSSASKNDLKIMLISIDDTPEDINYISNTVKCEVFSYKTNISRENFFECSDCCIKNACNRVECHQNVLMVFYNASNFVDAFAKDKILNKNASEIQARIMAENYFTDILNLACNYGDASLTIMSVDIPENLSSKSNCNIFVRDKRYEGTKCNVDIRRSSTRYIKNVFLDKHYEQYENLMDTLNENGEIEVLRKIIK